MIAIWSLALCACLWIVAWQLDTQAAIAGAVIITLAIVGVLAICWVLNRASH